jgi:hypothetical protein
MVQIIYPIRPFWTAAGRCGVYRIPQKDMEYDIHNMVSPPGPKDLSFSQYNDYFLSSQILRICAPKAQVEA